MFGNEGEGFLHACISSYIMKDDFTFRYARIYPGVNSRAELVTLAFGSTFQPLVNGQKLFMQKCAKQKCSKFDRSRQT